jgi:hypothetical protein
MLKDFAVEIVEGLFWHEPPFERQILAEYANPRADPDAF